MWLHTRLQSPLICKLKSYIMAEAKSQGRIYNPHKEDRVRVSNACCFKESRSIVYTLMATLWGDGSRHGAMLKDMNPLHGSLGLRYYEMVNPCPQDQDIPIQEVPMTAVQYLWPQLFRHVSEATISRVGKTLYIKWSRF